MTIIHGDCIEVMAGMDAASVDAVVTDPPYELGFMGKSWDRSGIAFDPATWEACLRVLKPGGYLLAFGGTRTFHRIAVAIEDAGFRLQDTLSWLHGQGFPKGKAQLKPGWEPIIMARKPGRAVLQIDACRIGTSKEIPASASAQRPSGYAMGSNRQDTSGMNPNIGRWPANVILDETAAALLDAQSGERKSGGGNKNVRNRDDRHAYGKGLGAGYGLGIGGDSGGASRFFYTAKASRAERNAGLDGMPERSCQATGWSGDGMPERRDARPGRTNQERPQPKAANHHPTVKPLSLMRWLVRLVTPPGGVVLDPFTGSGSTGAACVLEGFDFIGIEQDAEYVEIARKRIAHWTPDTAQLSLLEQIA